MRSKNMNYIFNVEYFKDIFAKRREENFFSDSVEEQVQEGNRAIFSHSFPPMDTPLRLCNSIKGYKEFTLYTLYPGLLVGVGNPHEIAVAGALKCGFSFDYVTGLPYITGSTLKGMLRSYFPGDTKDQEVSASYDSLIKGLLGNENLDVLNLKKHMFEESDIYLGAFPVVEGETTCIMDMEFITPHKEKFKNPNPISLAKVKPRVAFVFSFVFKDYMEKDTVLVSADEKAKLCKDLLLCMGIGAKTNVGFGRLSTVKPKMQKPLSQSDRNSVNKKNSNTNYQKSNQKTPKADTVPTGNKPPICKTCRKNECSKNKSGEYNHFCNQCIADYNKKRENSCKNGLV